MLIEINRCIRSVRRLLGVQSHFLWRPLAKMVMQFISSYEESIERKLRGEKLNGLIYGHNHHAEIKQIEDFLYVYTGDFVEGSTAIVEHFDDSLKLLRWSKQEVQHQERYLLKIKPNENV